MALSYNISSTIFGAFSLFFITLTIFWIEAAWDFSHAIDPATGEAVRLSQLRATPEILSR